LTICLAVKCKKSEKEEDNPAPLFASDTLEFSMHIKRYVTKMRIIFGKTPKKNKNPWNILIASTGDSMVIDEVLSDIERFLREKIVPDEKAHAKRLRLLQKDIGDITYSTYASACARLQMQKCPTNTMLCYI